MMIQTGMALALLPILGWSTTTLAPMPVPSTMAPFTTTHTAWDSSASSSDSGDSSGSLKSLGSGPGDSSSGYSSGSFNQGSWASDSSGSASMDGRSSGSTASGSWGSQLPIWLWIVLVCLLCCIKVGGIGACMSGGKKKPKKSAKKSKAKPAAASPVPAEAKEEASAPPSTNEPLLSVPPLMPLATTSQLIPSYSMVAAPQQSYTYAAPATTAYAQYAAPQTASYTYAQPAQQAYTYAAPATTQYATTQYAGPATGYTFGTTTGQVV